MVLEGAFPSSQISHFSKESYFFLLENNIRIQELCFLLLTPQENMCVRANPYVYTPKIFLYITIHIYIKLNMSSHWCPILIIYHILVSSLFLS